MRAHRLGLAGALIALPAVLPAQSRVTETRQFLNGQVGVAPRGDSILIRMESVGEADFQLAASRAGAAAWVQTARAEIPTMQAACARRRAGQPVYSKGLPLGRTANMQPGNEFGVASPTGLTLALKCARGESDMGKALATVNWELVLVANTPPMGAWRGGMAQTHSAVMSEVSAATPFLNALANGQPRPK